MGEAAIVQAKAGLAQAEALLRRAQRNLSYCTINSPVKGVIIDRRVNIGQTVVASLNAPSLFLIAKDLKRMQVWVAVNEADIGKIHPGQPVTFTVDAFPGETFRGEVGKVRLNATMTQNVVTYTVEIVTDNSNGRLLPYLTANVQFEVDRRDNVLAGAERGAALEAGAEQVAPELREALSRSGEGKEKANEGRRPAAGEPRLRRAASRAELWVPEGEIVRPLAVRVGLSDGTHDRGCRRRADRGTDGGDRCAAAGRAPRTDTSNPFAPQILARRRNCRQAVRPPVSRPWN